MVKSFCKKCADTYKSYNTDEKLIMITVISIFLPLFVAVVPVVVTVLWFLSDNRRRNVVLNCKGSIFILLMLPVFCLGAVLHGNWLGLLIGVLIWVFFMYAVYLRCFMTQRLFEMIVPLVLALSFFSAFVAFIQSFSDAAAREVSTFYNPNYYGYMIEIFIVLAFYRIVAKEGSLLFNLTAIAVNLYGLDLCNCRTAWVGIFIGAFAVLLFSKKYKYVWIVLALAVAFVLGIILFPGLLPRSDSINTAADQRSLIWGSSFKTAINAPFFGHGAYAYTMIWNAYSTGFKTVHCHNFLLNSFLDVGIIGSVMWLSYFITYPVSVIRKHCKNGEGRYYVILLSVLLATVSHCITDIPVLGIQTFIIFAMMLSCAGINEKKSSINYIGLKLL